MDMTLQRNVESSMPSIRSARSFADICYHPGCPEHSSYTRTMKCLCTGAHLVAIVRVSVATTVGLAKHGCSVTTGGNHGVASSIAAKSIALNLMKNNLNFDMD
jgi:hypothetical protein